MKPFVDFYEAWYFLAEHRIFKSGEINHFHLCFDIDVVKVCPETEKVSDDKAENTATRIWLECGPWCNPDQLTDAEKEHFPDGVPSHDIELDCGASTFERAIIKLANLVFKKYGS